MLRVGPDELDSARFERLLQEGRSAGSPGRAGEVLRDAQPFPQIENCYGVAWDYPGDDYPRWPPGSNPDPSHFV